MAGGTNRRATGAGALGVRSVLAVVAGVLASVLTGVVTPAAAATISSTGPLTSIVTSPDLNCEVNHALDVDHEFYLDRACGTFVAVGPTAASSTLYGPASIPAGDGYLDQTAFTPVSQSAVTGTGTAANPYTVVTVADAGSSVRVTQTDKYATGQNDYTTDLALTNRSGSTVRVVLYRAGDCYLGSSDAGYGRVTGSSIACAATEDPASRAITWVPVTAGSAYFEDTYDAVWSRVGSRQPFPNTCLCLGQDDHDNGAGLSWETTIAPGATATFTHRTDFSGNREEPPGDRAITTSKTVTPTSVGLGGTVTYSITFGNPNPVAVTLYTIVDSLPAGFTYQAGSTSGATTADPDVSTYLRWVGNFPVPANGITVLSFRATAAMAAGTFFNSADGGAYTADVTGAVNVAPVTIAADQPTLEAYPTVAEAGPGVYIGGSMNARLMDSAGQPIAGRTITFTSGTLPPCAAVTDEYGYANCQENPLDLIDNGGYTATFAGDAAYRRASDSAGLVRHYGTYIL